tara:strand:- start:420 stop:1028 length:609 start_codon:yes stop_codon:yes gene_type:complete
MKIFYTVVIILALTGCASKPYTEEVYIGNEKYPKLDQILKTSFEVISLNNNNYVVNVVNEVPIYSADVFRTDKVIPGKVQGMGLWMTVASAGIFSIYCAAGSDKACPYKSGKTVEGRDKILKNVQDTGKTESFTLPLPNSRISIYLNGSLVESIITNDSGQFQFDTESYGVVPDDDLRVIGIFDSIPFDLSLEVEGGPVLSL